MRKEKDILNSNPVEFFYQTIRENLDERYLGFFGIDEREYQQKEKNGFLDIYALKVAESLGQIVTDTESAVLIASSGRFDELVDDAFDIIHYVTYQNLLLFDNGNKRNYIANLTRAVQMICTSDYERILIDRVVSFGFFVSE